MGVSGTTTNFAGQVAVITGAASGLGSGLVLRAAELGMRIAIADVNASAIEERARELTEQGVEVLWRELDVRRPDELDQLANDVYDKWGAATVLFNNAGVELHGNTWDVPVEEWQRVIDINLNGVFYGIRAFAPRMIRSQNPAHIVNVSSVAALRVNPGTSAYAATKHAILALSECLAKELETVAPHIAVTAVLPGSVKSKIFESAFSTDDDGPGANSRRTLLMSMERNGLQPIDAARIIFDGVARGELRVHTDPEVSRRFIAERAQALTF